MAADGDSEDSGGSFWSTFGGNCAVAAEASALETLLQSPDCSVEALLDEEEVIQEFKACNDKLVARLSAPEAIRSLMRFVTEEPAETANNHRKFKYPFVAVELMICAGDAFLQAVVDAGHPEGMDALWAFLEGAAPEEINPVLAGYFSRTLVQLLSKRPDEVVADLRRRDPAAILERLLDRLHFRSLAELFSLLLLVEQPSHQVFPTAGLVMRVLQRIESAGATSDVHDNVKLIALQFFSRKDAACSEELLRQITSEEAVKFLFEQSFSPCASRATTATTILSSIILHTSVHNISAADVPSSPVFGASAEIPTTMLPAEDDIVTLEHVVKEVAPQRSPASPSSPSTAGAGENTASWLEDCSTALLSDISSQLSRLQAFLDDSMARSAAVSMPIGEVRTVGSGTLELVNLLVMLARTGSFAVLEALNREQVLPRCMELFFRHPWNSLLHNSILQLFSGVLAAAGSERAEIVLRLLGEGGLASRIVAEYTAEKAAASADVRHRHSRVGYMGHLHSICKELRDFGEKAAQCAEALDATPGWSDLVIPMVEERLTRHEEQLGGGVHASERNLASSGGVAFGQEAPATSVESADGFALDDLGDFDSDNTTIPGTPEPGGKDRASDDDFDPGDDFVPGAGPASIDDAAAAAAPAEPAAGAGEAAAFPEAAAPPVAEALGGGGAWPPASDGFGGGSTWAAFDSGFAAFPPPAAPEAEAAPEGGIASFPCAAPPASEGGLANFSSAPDAGADAGGFASFPGSPPEASAGGDDDDAGLRTKEEAAASPPAAAKRGGDGSPGAGGGGAGGDAVAPEAAAPAKEVAEEKRESPPPAKTAESAAVAPAEGSFWAQHLDAGPAAEAKAPEPAPVAAAAAPASQPQPAGTPAPAPAPQTAPPARAPPPVPAQAPPSVAVASPPLPAAAANAPSPVAAQTPSPGPSAATTPAAPSRGDVGSAAAAPPAAAKAAAAKVEPRPAAPAPVQPNGGGPPGYPQSASAGAAPPTAAARPDARGAAAAPAAAAVARSAPVTVAAASPAAVGAGRSAPAAANPAAPGARRGAPAAGDAGGAGARAGDGDGVGSASFGKGVKPEIARHSLTSANIGAENLFALLGGGEIRPESKASPAPPPPAPTGWPAAPPAAAASSMARPHVQMPSRAPMFDPAPSQGFAAFPPPSGAPSGDRSWVADFDPFSQPSAKPPSAPFGGATAPFGGSGAAPFGGAGAAPFGGAAAAPFGGGSAGGGDWAAFGAFAAGGTSAGQGAAGASNAAAAPFFPGGASGACFPAGGQPQAAASGSDLASLNNWWPSQTSGAGAGAFGSSPW